MNTFEIYIHACKGSNTFSKLIIHSMLPFNFQELLITYNYNTNC